MQFESLIYYLTDLSLVDYKLVKFLPSMIAASAVFLVRVIITRSKMNPWCPALQEYTGYKAVDLRECVLIIHDLFLGTRGGSLVAVRDKYKQTELNCVAKMHCPSQLPHSLFEAVKARRKIFVARACPILLEDLALCYVESAKCQAA